MNCMKFMYVKGMKCKCEVRGLSGILTASEFINAHPNYAHPRWVLSVSPRRQIVMGGTFIW